MTEGPWAVSTHRAVGLSKEIHMCVHFKAAQLLGHNWERSKVGNVTLLGIRDKVGRQESKCLLKERCRSPEKAPYPVKKFREGFLEEGIFELDSRIGGVETVGSTSGGEGQWERRPTMDGLVAQLHV